MHAMGVDRYGVEIMAPKAQLYLVRMDSLPCVCANILKQEMLSLGADAAVSRDALTGKVKKTDCLLIGTLSQFTRLNEKIRQQPFGLDLLGRKLSLLISDYQHSLFTLRLRRYTLNLGMRSHIMGIVNLTPDSFSQDGLYIDADPGRNLSGIIRFVRGLVEDGADIIDIGAESSRPGAKPVSAKEEIKRIMPALKLIIKKFKVPVSVDTYKPQVVEQALDNGADLINDITGLKDLRTAKLIARYKAGVVIMHMKGNPRNMQQKTSYDSLIDDIIEYLRKRIDTALSCGISKNRIIIDPGLGFAKAAGDNLKILNNLSEFKILGEPILVGPSRKSFLGKILNAPVQERLLGTVSACILALRNGAHIVRVHDVRQLKQALQVADSINKA